MTIDPHSESSKNSPATRPAAAEYVDPYLTAPRSSALLTDMYELTMLEAALQDGTAHRQCAFEVFTRRLPNERRYGVVAGTARVLRAIRDFIFTEDQLAHLDFLNEETKEYLRNYRFTGQVDGYREGELYFPQSPIMTVRGTFAECVVLETVILSILNSDSAVASAAARMVTAAAGRPIIEMGSRRTHEYSAVSSARAAYLAGFTATSNLEAAYRYDIPASGTAAHAWTLLHTHPDGTTDEEAAFRAQVETHGVGTTLLVDTYDIAEGVATAVRVAGPELGGVRIDSGDLGVLAQKVRAQLDSLGAHNTKIIVSSDMDEFSIAALRSEPVDVFGVGTSATYRYRCLPARPGDCWLSTLWQLRRPFFVGRAVVPRRGRQRQWPGGLGWSSMNVWSFVGFCVRADSSGSGGQSTPVRRAIAPGLPTAGRSGAGRACLGIPPG